MNRSNLWRAVALTALVGWAGTAAALVMVWTASPTASNPAMELAQADNVGHPSDRPAHRRRTRDRAPRRVSVGGAGDGGADLDVVRQEARRQVLEEIDAERSERRKERSERHMNHLLDEVAQFAEANNLSESQQAALETAMSGMHERMEALRPERGARGGEDRGPGRRGPSDEVIEQMVTSLAQLEADAMHALDDEELAAEFADKMTPRPLRDGPPPGRN